MKFIPNFSQHRKYVNKLRKQYQDEISEKKYLKANEKKKIAEKYNVEFRKIFKIWKDAIMHTRLQIPPKETDVHIFTDSSGDAFGYCAYDEERRIIEFGGKTCLPAHMNYDIICKELQAILEMCHTFKLIIARAKRVVVHVDNKAAVSFLKGEEKCHNDRAFRLVTRIKMFPKLEFVRVDTKSNPSDAPSRLINWDEIANSATKETTPNKNAESENIQKFHVSPFIAPKNEQLAHFLSVKQHKKSTTNDLVLPNEENTFQYSSKIKVDEVSNFLSHQKFNFELHELAKDISDSKSTVEETFSELVNVLDTVVDSRSTLLQLATAIHEKFGPHCGQNRLYKILKFVHPEKKFTKSICDEVLKSCPECVSKKRELPKNVVSNRRFAEKPLDIISIDHFTYTSVRDRAGYTSIFSIRDEFSRFVVIFPVYTHSIKEAIHNLRLFINFLGTPNVIHMDNFFDCKEMSNFLETEGIIGSTSPAYNAASNGVVERVHLDLRKSIPLIMKEMNLPIDRWSEVLHVAAGYINFSECRSTKFAPMMLMRGCLPSPYFPVSVQMSKKALSKMWDIARNNSRKNREMNLRQPKENKGKFSLLQPGTPVFIYLGPKGKKQEKATVLHDNGVSVRVQKLGQKTRFNIITVHKSRIAKRLETTNLALSEVVERLNFSKRRQNFAIQSLD